MYNYFAIKNRYDIMFMSLMNLPASRAPANNDGVPGVGVSAPCGAVSIRGTAVFVAGVLEL